MTVFFHKISLITEEKGDIYEYSLGLNGLGACATQYSSEFMDVEVFRDGYKYDLHFEKGRNVGGLKKEETKQKKTGTKTHWRPDLEVFTDIKIENEYFEDVLKKQAVVNPNITFILRIQRENSFYLVSLGIKQSLWSLLASLIVIVMMYLFLPYSLFILPFWPLSFICFVTCFNCYPVIRKHVIQPYYDQRGESNPEFAYKNADPDEQLFEDRAAEETPVKTKESRKKGKTIS